LKENNNTRNRSLGAVHTNVGYSFLYNCKNVKENFNKRNRSLESDKHLIVGYTYIYKYRCLIENNNRRDSLDKFLVRFVD